MTSRSVIIHVWLLFCFMTPMSAMTPPPLKPGDTIGLASPARASSQEEIALCCKKIESLGYKVRLASNLKLGTRYLAGTDAERAEGLMQLWRDPEVKGIWCLRGGYGSARLLPYLDFDYMEKHPKFFLGMSDVTALHLAIQKKTNLTTFIGPTAAYLFAFCERPYAEAHVLQAMRDSLSGPILHPPSFAESQVLVEGKAQGKITGGNLCLIASLIGTPWEIETENRILILEEVSEEPFRIDRMLNQLKQAGLLEKCAGVILASFSHCDPDPSHDAITLDEVFEHYFGNAPYPVLLHFPFGHIHHQTTLPMGAQATLDTQRKTLTLETGTR